MRQSCALLYHFFLDRGYVGSLHSFESKSWTMIKKLILISDPNIAWDAVRIE